MNQDLLHLWRNFLSELQKTEISPITYDTFFKQLSPIKFEDDTLYINTPTSFIGDHICNNESYHRYMVDIFSRLTGKNLNFKFLVGDSQHNSFQPTSQDQLYEKSRLNPKYTFDTFVVGKSNEFAHAASVSVADSLEKANANPLFIYGGVGLGKTHLMHAIGHFVLDRDPEKKVLYVTSEQFTNEFINSIRTNKNEHFRHKYRSMDLLLIDDIQFIADKETTMEEFFHTFNDLYNAGKQIVITSDKPPREIKHLEDRLVSRFNYGIIADISRPDYETRVAILQKKLEDLGAIIDNNILSYIALEIDTNIRDLEGALSTAIAYAKSDGRVEVSMEDAIKGVGTRVKNKRKKLTIADIQQAVSSKYNVKLADLKGKSRKKEIVNPRQIAMYISRELLDDSLVTIANAFDRDHTTVIHGIDKITDLMDEDEDLKNEIEALIKEIRD